MSYNPCPRCGQNLLYDRIKSEAYCVSCGFRQAATLAPAVLFPKPPVPAPVPVRAVAVIPRKPIKVEVMKKEEAAVSNTGNAHAKHEYINLHKVEIIADIVRLGPDNARAKWKNDISISCWLTLQKRWRIEIDTAYRQAGGAKGPIEASSFGELQTLFQGYRQAVIDIFGPRGDENLLAFNTSSRRVVAARKMRAGKV